MIAHVVMFRPKPHLAADERGALVASFSRALREIPSIRHSRVGRRVTHGRGYEQSMRENYEYIALLEFDDVAGLKTYLEHPAHHELAERFFSAFETALMYDYEMSDGGLAALL
jgi:Stress responsive A/B Barrel Domain